VEATPTPLWADAKRTLKKGLLAQGTEFIVNNVEYVKDQDMAKTDSVAYIRKGDGLAMRGDGWIELKNCSAVAPALEPVTTPDETAVAFLRQLRDALDVVIRDWMA
jgi:hypothetical protein